MIRTVARNLRHWNGRYLRAVPGGFDLVEDPMQAGRWTEANAAALLPMLTAFYLRPDHFTIVDAPSCGCCGEYHPPQLREVAGSDWKLALRCEKHDCRLPCIIQGCGRTFKRDLFDSYETRVCCGRHWRMAPRYMRDRVTKLRRRAVRLDWPDRLASLHSTAWEACIRAIERRGDVGGDGHIDVDEIAAMFGFDD